MKKIFICFIFGISILSCSGSDGSTSDNKCKISNLNIISNNTAFVQSNSLAQIGSSASGKVNLLYGKSGTAAAGTEITEVTTETGVPVTVTNAIQVNSRYIFLQNLTTTDDTTTEEDYILNVSTGETVPLPVWPSNVKKIASSSDRAFFASGGSIYSVEFTTGKILEISSSGLYWTYSSAGYTSSKSSWGSPNFIYYDDDNSKLYVILTTGLSSGHYQGMGARFSYTVSDGIGIWTEDTEFNATYFQQTPAYFGSVVPGSGLSAGAWLLNDQVNSRLYYMETTETGFTDGEGVTTWTYHIKVYNYLIESFSKGELLYSKDTSNYCIATTYFGYNDTIQGSLMTDGKTIFKMVADTGGSVTVEEIVVPSDVPVSNSIILNSGYVSYYGPGAVTNWTYLDGKLYILDPDTSGVYQWDMSSTFVADSLADKDDIKFLY